VGTSELQATVIEAGDTTLVLAVHKLGRVVEPGAVIDIRHELGGFTGAASLKDIEITKRFALFHMGDLVWHGKVPRAHRHTHEFSVTADYYSESEDLKRTIGQTLDLSASGSRVRLRSAVKKGTVARLVICIGEDKYVEALGRVARIVQGSESSGGGYEVGFHFERIIRGQDELMSMAPDENCHTDDSFSFMDDILGEPSDRAA
jgi:hypothetical protein